MRIQKRHNKRLRVAKKSPVRLRRFSFYRSPAFFMLALVLGMMLAMGVSVLATSVGNNIQVTGNLTVETSSASSSVTYALGVGTSTPAVIFAVGGASGNTTGHGYFTGGLGVGAITTASGRVVANSDFGVATTTPAQELSVVGDGYITSGLGVGVATTTAGAIQNIGNVLLGDASGDLVMFNSASLIYNNQGTTTLPLANANAWSYATSTANVPLVKLDTSNTRVGVSTTTPGATLAVGGDGTALIMGNATSVLSIQTTSAGTRGGCIEVEATSGDGTRFSLMATSAGIAYWTTGGCR